MRLIDADAFWKPFEDEKEELENRTIKTSSALTALKFIDFIKRRLDIQPTILQPERKKGQNDQPESAKEYCAECDHIEMCGWYPYEGCEFRSIPQPQRKTGKWITEVKHYKDESQDFYYEHTCCSICGTKKRIGWYDAKYCPRCGADMRGE